MKRIVILLPIMFFSGCAQWLPANSEEISKDVFQVWAAGNVFASQDELQLKIDKKSADLCAPKPYKYIEPADFKFHKQDVYVSGATHASNYIELKRIVACEGAKY